MNVVLYVPKIYGTLRWELASYSLEVVRAKIAGMSNCDCIHEMYCHTEDTHLVEVITDAED